MQQDIFGQDLLPGDYVIISNNWLLPGVYVGTNNRGKYYIQAVWMYDTIESRLAHYKSMLDEAIMGKKIYLGSVSYPQTGNKVMRVPIEAFPAQIQELLGIVKQLCILKKKIK